MTGSETNAEASAAYYDDANVAEFYRLFWGGSDIHIGRYDSGDESIADASAAMTRYLIGLAGLDEGDKVLDIACGYGGTLRMLAHMGCKPNGIDISSVCVDEARRANAEQGLADRIDAVVGDFHDIPVEADSWDAVICQDSLIHSTDRPRVFSEVFRVLRPGGIFAFSDIMTAEGADLELVNQAFERLGVKGGATPRDYKDMAVAAGFQVTHAEERPADIRTHYDKLAEQLAGSDTGLAAETAKKIAASIGRWQKALHGGHITWACFIARKPG
ncbi:SAM-dependent methyltransferase [Dichotomicrobium thermohalophilum]|uniref:Sarcosine/dimethylglycine N-methyltransferase n=1 Tax=Dichotomicrobium thermohalophilum TaxID=933063 RepID=A0A397PK41_9HYPH|nr:class I SAM-dependent methyltransferase [Dichotomicrobium thermohalophilum]RIA47635.1 sarcosine/dimethylglycine N-methyltransferase [Dichotomicrobium thermohalophilum]